MKSLSTYIFEKMETVVDNSAACVYSWNIDKFKSKEICEALDIVREFINKHYGGLSEDIYFCIYENDELRPIKYVYNDQGVVTFEEFDKRTLDKYNKKCYTEFYNSIRDYKTGVVQFSIPGFEKDFNFTVNTDTVSDRLVIVFSKGKPMFYKED